MFALKGDPTDASSNDLTAPSTPDLAGPVGRELALNLAGRAGARFSGTPSPSATIDGIRYTIEGSLDLGSYETHVSKFQLPSPRPSPVFLILEAVAGNTIPSSSRAPTDSPARAFFAQESPNPDIPACDLLNQRYEATVPIGVARKLFHVEGTVS